MEVAGVLGFGDADSFVSEDGGAGEIVVEGEIRQGAVGLGVMGVDGQGLLDFGQSRAEGFAGGGLGLEEVRGDFDPGHTFFQR